MNELWCVTQDTQGLERRQDGQVGRTRPDCKSRINMSPWVGIGLREWHRHIYTTMCKLASGEAAVQHWVSSVPCDDLEAWDEAWWWEVKREGFLYIYILELIHVCCTKMNTTL